MFYIDRDEQLTYSDAKAYIDAFKTNEYSRLKMLDNYYKNKNNKISLRTMGDEFAPNNKISHSFAHYITTTNTTIFIGEPVNYKSDEDITVFQETLDIADEQNVNYNLAKDASKYGYAIELMYLDEELHVQFTNLDPLHTVIIMSNDIKPKVLYAISFWENKNVVTNHENKYVTIYSKEGKKEYKNDLLINEETNTFCDIPVIIYKNNDDMIGDYELAIPLIDEYDLLESDSANESEAFNNCYFYMNIEIPQDKEEFEALQEKIRKMKEKHNLVGEDLNPQFIVKPHNENETEKLRVVSDIHKLTYTPDMSDNNFANNVSGVAMKYKLLGTLNNIKNKQAQFKKAINLRNKLLFDLMNYRMLETPNDVDIIFTISLPENLADITSSINQLRGMLSNKTLIAQLPFITDPAFEQELLEQENNINSFDTTLEEDDKDEEN